MCHIAKVDLVKHQSWHSFRRTVETVVMDELASDPLLKRHTELIVHNFMRYKSSSIVQNYYTNENVDQIVMEHHPVLEYWR
jgi:hypothetical protein